MSMTEFNPSKVEKTVISIRIEMEKLKTIDALSSERDISRNEFILQCIDFALNNIKNSDK